MFSSLLCEGGEIRKLVGDIGACKFGLRYRGKNRRVKAIPLCEKIFWSIGLGAEPPAKAIGLVTDLKGKQTRTEDLIRSRGLPHRILNSALSKIEPVKAGPVRRIKELAQIAKGERGGYGSLLNCFRSVRTKDFKGRRA